MNPTITKLIDQYLSGELNTEELAAFKERILNNPDLQKEVELQKSVMDAAKRATQREEVRKSAKEYRTNRLIKNAGLSILIAGLITATTLLIINAFSKDDVTANVNPEISKELIANLNKNQDFDNVPIQYFQIPEEGSIQLSDQGVLISVPETAFLKDGKPFRGNVILQYQEAITGADIVKSGLSTMTGDELLETQGMFSVAGYTEDGIQLEFNPEIGVYIQSPVDECKNGMQLYDGKKLEDGSIDWQNPVPLSKIPVAVNVNDLDFYPENYESELDAKLWKKDKKSRDSLYLSLDEQFIAQKEISDTMTPDFNQEFEEDVDVRQKKMIERKSYAKRKERAPIIPPVNLINWQFTIEMRDNDEADIVGRAVIAPNYFIVASRGNFDQMKVGAKRTSIVCSENVDFHSLGTTTDQTARVMTNFKGNQIPALSGDIEIRQRIKLNTDRSIRVPFRYIFHLFNKDLSYSPSLQSTSILIDRNASNTELIVNTDMDTLMLDRSYVYPSKVMAFWNPAFNETNLATREFERRMSAIHGTCNNDVLNAYTKNLRMPLSEIDQKVVNMGYRSFQKFADENIGAVDIDNPHYKQLKRFYDKAVDALKADAKRNVQDVNENMKAWNKYINEARNKDQERSQARERKNILDDKNFNRAFVAQQLKNTNGFTITRGSFGSLTARKNCDALRRNYVAYQGKITTTIEMLENEVSLTPPTLNKCSFTVPDEDKYVQLYAYVFANKINSYQRLSGKDGVFECSMNDEQIYDVGIVGITDKGYEYFQKMTIKGGELGTIKMNSISEEKLDASIEQLNKKRLPKPMEIESELDWLKSVRKNYQVQKEREEMFEFRENLKMSIFPCYQPLVLDEGKDDISENIVPIVFYE